MTAPRARKRGDGPVARAAAAGVVGLCALTVVTTVGALRERDQLPSAAHAFLAATVQATEVTTCLQGARDELFLPGVGELHTEVAKQAALTRLRSCDISQLSRSLAAVHLPPAAPLTDAKHRAAEADITTGLATLHRVVQDAYGADKAMTAQVHGSTNAIYVILAYRSADTGTQSALSLADQALALLGQPQSSVGA